MVRKTVAVGKNSNGVLPSALLYLPKYRKLAPE
jgi:hypothetical protein